MTSQDIASCKFLQSRVAQHTGDPGTGLRVFCRALACLVAACLVGESIEELAYATRRTKETLEQDIDGVGTMDPDSTPDRPGQEEERKFRLPRGKYSFARAPGKAKPVVGSIVRLRASVEAPTETVLDTLYARVDHVQQQRCTGVVVECPRDWPAILRGPSPGPVRVGDTVSFDVDAIHGTLEATQRAVDQRREKTLKDIWDRVDLSTSGADHAVKLLVRATAWHVCDHRLGRASAVRSLLEAFAEMERKVVQNGAVDGALVSAFAQAQRRLV